MRDFIEEYVLYLVGVVVAAFLAVGIYYAVQEQTRWESECKANGGHVVTDSDFVTTVHPNGQVGVGSNTDYFCLTEDGRIIGTH